MKRLCVMLTLIFIAGCGRGGALGDLPYVRGATVVGTTSTEGEMFGFPPARWEQVELRSAAPYTQVRDFYARLRVSGWTSTFEHESAKSTGRIYWRYLADSRRRVFYVIMVEEHGRFKDVSVILRRGLAR